MLFNKRENKLTLNSIQIKCIYIALQSFSLFLSLSPSLCLSLSLSVKVPWAFGKQAVISTSWSCSFINTWHLLMHLSHILNFICWWTGCFLLFFILLSSFIFFLSFFSLLILFHSFTHTHTHTRIHTHSITRQLDSSNHLSLKCRYFCRMAAIKTSHKLSRWLNCPIHCTSLFSLSSQRITLDLFIWTESDEYFNCRSHQRHLH